MPNFEADCDRVRDWIASYRTSVESLPVFPSIRPGDVLRALPEHPPEEPEPLESLLSDLDSVIVPGLTHWNHPGFMAYFCSSTAEPGILAEFVTAAVNVNAMLWRSAPSATELEERMVGWTREFVGLPASFGGVIQDTASTSSFVALLAARHAALPDSRSAGLTGGSAPGRVYVSGQAHSSLDKAVIAAGLGHDHLVRVEVDDVFAMRPDALRTAVQDDLAAGRIPVMVCATIGTASSTAVDPVAEIASICERFGLWLHVDAAYAGPAASVDELAVHFAGWERADSIVLNPHKWMSVPLDCSLLLCRRLDLLRDSLAVTPEYLRGEDEATNLMDVGLALGRRFRALKLWFVFRMTGAEGLRSMIRKHRAMALQLAKWVDADPRFERAAPVPFSTVCFRALDPEGDPVAADDRTRRIMTAVNREGRVFLSHTMLDGRFTIRVAIGNVHTHRSHVAAAWDSVTRAVEAVTDHP